jgi:hypothetical protein
MARIVEAFEGKWGCIRYGAVYIWRGPIRFRDPNSNIAGP